MVDMMRTATCHSVSRGGGNVTVESKNCMTCFTATAAMFACIFIANNVHFVYI